MFGPSMRRRKKERIEVEMSDRVRVMTNFCNVHTNLSIDPNVRGEKASGNSWVSPCERPLSVCIHWLSDLTPPLQEPLYHAAIDHLLENKDIQYVFIEMPPERRLEWLHQL